MKKVIVEPYKLIGIAVRTSNATGQAAADIGGLWEKYMGQQTTAKIPNRISDTILAVYTNYEGDHMKPYDTIIGCKVSSLDEIPEGMVSCTVTGGDYMQFTTNGDLSANIVYDEWASIWNKNLDRVYTADFEVYDERAMNPANAVVDILIALKD